MGKVGLTTLLDCPTATCDKIHTCGQTVCWFALWMDTWSSLSLFLIFFTPCIAFIWIVFIYPSLQCTCCTYHITYCYMFGRTSAPYSGSLICKFSIFGSSHGRRRFVTSVKFETRWRWRVCALKRVLLLLLLLLHWSTKVLSHEEKCLFLMYFWTLNSNMFPEFLYHPHFSLQVKGLESFAPGR
jgi:hypothetical protein